jgi:hypothetical protein
MGLGFAVSSLLPQEGGEEALQIMVLWKFKVEGKAVGNSLFGLPHGDEFPDSPQGLVLLGRVALTSCLGALPATLLLSFLAHAFPLIGVMIRKS